MDDQTRKIALGGIVIATVGTGLFLAWMQHLASLNDNYYDLRNEDAVKLSKVCIRAIDEAGMIPHVRLI